MVEWVEIGRARLACGDCRDILPTLGKVDAVVDNCDAVVFNQQHEKSAKRQRKSRDTSGVDLGTAQDRDRGALCERGSVSSADGGALRGDTGGLSKSASEAWASSEVEGAQGESERSLQGWDAKHCLSGDGHEGQVQPLWGNGSACGSSQGRGAYEQRAEQSGSPLLALPQQPPQAGVVVRKKGRDVAIVTDPPYGIGADKAASKNNGKWGWTYYGETNWDSARLTAMSADQKRRITPADFPHANPDLVRANVAFHTGAR